MTRVAVALPEKFKVGLIDLLFQWFIVLCFGIINLYCQINCLFINQYFNRCDWLKRFFNWVYKNLDRQHSLKSILKKGCRIVAVSGSSLIWRTTFFLEKL